jgi:RHS repeat-associated protein
MPFSPIRTHGQRACTHAQAACSAGLGYNGQLHESGGWWQFLGNGRRVYNLVLMRFHSPDSLSPFGKGGINAYAYCGCDPINNTDPTGQFLLPVAALMGVGAVGMGAVAGMLDAQGSRKEAGILGTIAGLLGAASMIAGGMHAFRPVRLGARVKNTTLAHGDVIIWRAPDRDIVRVHANRGRVELKAGQASTGKDLARVYMDTPMGKSRRVPVELQACYGGLGGAKSVGQTFADAAKVPVTAYAGLVDVLGASKQPTASSRRVVFRPQSSVASASSDRNNDLNWHVRRLRSQHS